MSDWKQVVSVEEIPQLGARVVETANGNIAIFRNAEDKVFALKDECPHKKGPLSQGIVHGSVVTCPLHNWNIDLASGEAQGPDVGCTNAYATKVEDGMVFISL